MKRTMSALLLSIALAAPAGRTGEFTLDSAPFGDFPDPSSQMFPGFGQKTDAPILTASLVPETKAIAPGKPFTVLVTLQHAPQAYSYWTNPGGPGVGTTVDWTLPGGFAVSPPEYPAPQLYTNGGMTFHVHKGRASIVYTVTPPDNLPEGTEITLKAAINTQACTVRTCTPLRLQAETTLTVAKESELGRGGIPNPAIAAAKSAIPSAPKGWRFDPETGVSEIILHMTPEAEGNLEPGAIHFFDSRTAPVADSQKPQTLEKTEQGWTLRIPLLPESANSVPGAPDARDILAGVLRAENGWLKAAPTIQDFRIEQTIRQTGTGAGHPPGAGRAVEQRAWALLLFAFVGGLLLNIMPCVFPVISLKIMGFARQAHKDRRSVFLHGVLYAAGVLICFWALAVLVITMGRGWGAQLQSDWFLFALCHIFLIMSMNMAGVFEVGTLASGAGQGKQDGLKRSFLTGLLATLTSTPCSAPFLGTALAYALSLPPALSIGVFTLMGLGFAFPYLALSLFPGLLKRLPKPGAWMDTFRQAMCFPLFATTAYLFWTMEAMVEEWQFLMLLFGLVLTAMACWLYGKHQKSIVKRPKTARALMALAVLALAGGVWIGMPARTAELQWMEWSPETVAQLRQEGRPVYVDFTARWCATCQLNKRVYLNDEIKTLIKEKNVALVKADWTLYDDRITRTLKTEFNKAAIPVNAVYAPGDATARLLPDLLTTANVTEALRTLP